MENILHDFEEKVISLMTEFLKNSIASIEKVNSIQ